MNILDIPSDKYTRNLIISKLVDTIRTKNQLRILEIGGRGSSLKQFFQIDELYTMDILLPQEGYQDNYLLGDIREPPFKDNSFDVVISTDVYEHISPKYRLTSISEMLRLSSNFAILGAPFYSHEVETAEISINDFFLKNTGVPNIFLKEHIENVLPFEEELLNYINNIGYDFQKIGTNNIINWLLIMFLLSYEGKNDIILRGKIKEIWNFYNQNFIELGDSLEPTYRKIYLIGKLGTLPQVKIEENRTLDELKRQEFIILVLNTIIENSVLNDTQLTELNNDLNSRDMHIQDLDNQISSLENQIRTIDESIIIQSLKKYQKVIDRLLRTGTRRRRFYELMLTGIRTILNEGWSIFFKKVKYWLRITKTIPHKQKLNLPRFESKVSPKAVKNIIFPVPSQKPEVSIIIPTFNKWKYTYNCFKSISENTDGDYEVIIVDDASNDKTVEIFSKADNLRLIRNEQNAGFIESCNRGARESKGQYILFLNNDTMATENWLPPLLEVIKREDVGAVGSMLVYSNGTLQEAGSIVWNDGSALGYGRGDDPEKSEYNYLREVDYCSGACLLVKRELFEKIGRFNEMFKPGYYEDTDLCLSIKNFGYKVMYQPKSVIVHFEGITGGTDVSSGIKKYQEINHPKFVEKWDAVLKKHHYPPTMEKILWARDRNPLKSILILDDRIPTPSQGAGYPRAHSMLRYIRKFGYRVTFFPLDNTAPWQPYTYEFQQSGIEMFYGDDLNFTKFAEDRALYYDMILVSRPHNMKKTYNTIKKYFPTAFLLYDAEAMFSIREILKAKVRGTKLEEQSAERMMNEEIKLINKADSVITVSEGEKQLILEKTRVNNVNVWGHSIEIKEPKTPFSERKDILFVGGFLAIDSPNEDAILYFAREVFPKVSKELSCRLFIVGTNPPDAVKKLSSSSIIVTGYIEDLTEYYEKCRVFIVPHRYSAGIPWKLQEAMSYGIPSVISELTRSQLNLTDGREVLVADSIEEFKQKVIRLYQEEELWNRIQKNALQYIKEECNPDILKTRLQDIIERGLK